MAKLVTPDLAHDFYLRLRGCKQRSRFRTLGMAKQEAQRVGREFGYEVKPYACHYCGAFHLGKKQETSR